MRTVLVVRVGTYSWFSVYSSSYSHSILMAWTCLSFRDLVMWVWLDIVYPVLIISLCLCRTCPSNSGCLLEISMTTLLLTKWSQAVAVFNLILDNWYFYSVVRLCTGQESSSASSNWPICTHWAVLFGLSRCISFAHISQILPRFCSSNPNVILLTLSF